MLTQDGEHSHNRTHTKSSVCQRCLTDEPLSQRGVRLCVKAEMGLQTHEFVAFECFLNCGHCDIFLLYMFLNKQYLIVNICMYQTFRHEHISVIFTTSQIIYFVMENVYIVHIISLHFIQSLMYVKCMCIPVFYVYIFVLKSMF